MEDPIKSDKIHGWVKLKKEILEVSSEMKFGSRYLYSSPEEIEKVNYFQLAILNVFS